MTSTRMFAEEAERDLKADISSPKTSLGYPRECAAPQNMRQLQAWLHYVGSRQ